MGSVRPIIGLSARWSIASRQSLISRADQLQRQNIFSKKIKIKFQSSPVSFILSPDG